MKEERGFALLLVLWSLVLLTLVATAIGVSGRGEVRLADNLRRAAVVQAATDGAVEEAAYHLMEPPPAGWAADGGTHVLRLEGAVVSLRVSDESGRLDLDTAPVGLLQALLRAVGQAPEAAAEVAQRIVGWRAPPAAGEGPAQDQAYRRLGLPYGPPGAPFESVDELGLVPGVTPALLAALQPHLTVYSQGRFDPALSDPVVREAVAAVGIAPTPGGTTQQQGLRTVRVEAQGTGAGGVRAGRSAVLRVGAQATGVLKVLTWE